MGLDPEAAYVVFNRFKNILLTTLDSSIIGMDQQTMGVTFTQEKTSKGALVKDLFTYMSEK